MLPTFWSVPIQSLLARLQQPFPNLPDFPHLSEDLNSFIHRFRRKPSPWWAEVGLELMCSVHLCLPLRYPNLPYLYRPVLLLVCSLQFGQFLPTPYSHDLSSPIPDRPDFRNPDEDFDWSTHRFRRSPHPMVGGVRLRTHVVRTLGPYPILTCPTSTARA